MPALAVIYVFIGLIVFLTYRENIDDKLEKELALKIHK